MYAVQRRHRSRGQWHVCPWCGVEFEGRAVAGFCSGECADEERHYREDMQDALDDWGAWEMEHDEF